jgi:hypothetical protein
MSVTDRDDPVVGARGGIGRGTSGQLWILDGGPTTQAQQMPGLS